MRYLALVFAALTLVSCNRDPNYLKEQYVQRGNQFMKNGKFKEAEITYKKAVATDRKYGEGYYRLALAYLKEGNGIASVRPFRVAVELLQRGTPESNDAMLKLGELEASAVPGFDKPEQLLKDVQEFADDLLKRNPNSWEGHKLKGDLALLGVRKAMAEDKGPEAKSQLAVAIAEFRASLQGNANEYQTSLSLGRVLELDGQTGEAETIFTQLIQKEKDNPAAYLDLYQLYLAERKLPEAESILKKAISTNPKDTRMRLELARYYLATNRRPELLAMLDGMKSNLKDFPQAYIQAGDFFVRVGQFDEAIKQFEEGIGKDPKNKVTYLKHEVETYVHANKMQLATAKNEEILKLDPKDPEARALRATLALDKGDFDSALTELQSVVTARPQNYVAHFNLGRAHLGKGQLEQARQEFDKAVEIRPDYVVARVAQTQVALLRGDVTAALHYADELLRYAPNSVEGRVMKAAALQREQKFDEARALLAPALEKNPNVVPIMLELGVLDLQQKKNKDALEMFHRAYVTDSGSVRALVGESRAYLADGQTQKSIQIIQDEVNKNPERLDLQRELGNAQLTAYQFQAAIGTYQQLIGKLKDPRQQSALYIQMGRAYHYAGDLQHSIEAYEKSRNGTPDTAPVMRDLGTLYEEAGKRDMARKYYQAALGIDSTDPLALNNLAYMIAENGGDLNEALGYAQRAKLKLPNYTEITDTLGWIYLKKNLTDNAIDMFKGLVAQAPQVPAYHYHYAVALSKKGDRESARRECLSALANKPNKAQEDQIRQLLSQVS
jgi:tetratricopeptide (TPR) repeat protein